MCVIKKEAAVQRLKNPVQILIILSFPQSFSPLIISLK